MSVVETTRLETRARIPMWAGDLQEMFDLLAAEVHGDLAGEVAGVSIDSRTLDRGDLFFALAGPRFDGHDYLMQVAERGDWAAVVARDRLPRLPQALPLLAVDDPLGALQRLAAWHRRRCGAKVVLITGSSGKTTTKEFAAAALSGHGQVHKTRGNRNNEIGLPLTLLELRDHDFAVIEAGTNHPGELSVLTELARPDVGVVTGIGPAHLEFFGDEEGVAREKAAAIRDLPSDGVAILPQDDPWFGYLFGRASAPVIGFGFDRHAAVRASRVESDWHGSRFLLHLPDGTFVRVYIPRPGQVNILNALAAAAVAWHFGVPPESYLDGLARAALPEWRSEVQEENGIILFADCYNSNPQSMEAALRTLVELPVQGRRIVIACEMLELGPDSEEWHRRVGRKAARLGIDWLVAVGGGGPIADGAQETLGSPEVDRVSTHDEAVELVLPRLAPGDAVLVKGSRAAHPEAVIHRLAAELRDGRV